MEEKASLTYIRQIDGLRCIAILMVLMYHWFVNVIPSPFIKSIPWGIGVVLFFVISGYLITSILIKARSDIDEGRSTPRRELLKFFYRRSLRIFPLYFIVSGIFVFCLHQEISKQVPYIFTYTLNLYQTFGGKIHGALMHYWSLCVEEQFYLLWPFLIFLLPTRSNKFLIPGIIALSIVSRICFNFSEYKYTSGGFTLNSFDALGVGALIAYIKMKNLFAYSVLKSRVVFTFLLLVFFMFYCGGYSSYAFVNHTFPMYVVLVFGMMVYIAVNGGFLFLGKWVLENPLAVYIGRISYGIYIIHNFSNLLFFGGKFYWFFPWATTEVHFFLSYFIITVTLASISWFLIERPILSLKYKWFN